METKKVLINVLKFVLPVVVVLLMQMSASAQNYTQNEQDCYNQVQGKVAYDKAGNKKWSEANVRNLCKGTTYPARTIDCFNLSIANYNDWKRGISECSQATLNNPVIDPVKDNTQNEQDCYNLVQGKVAYDKAGNKNWSETNVRRLCKNTAYPARTIDCFNLRMANYGDWKRGVDECSAELNGKWIGYSGDGKLSSYRWEIAGLASIDAIDPSNGKMAYRGLRSGNNISTTFKDHTGNILSGKISNNGTRIDWSNNTIWIKDNGKPPAATVPVK
ncbi:MAG: hypothetical protein WBC19_00910 [Pyrinomonadaceae bacterium]